MTLVREALADAGNSKSVFPAEDGRPLASPVVTRAISRAHETSEDRPLGRFGIEAWSAHDLRRTVLNNLAKLGVVPHVIAHVAHHRSLTKSGVTFAHYVTIATKRKSARRLICGRTGSRLSSENAALQSCQCGNGAWLSADAAEGRRFLAMEIIRVMRAYQCGVRAACQRIAGEKSGTGAVAATEGDEAVYHGQPMEGHEPRYIEQRYFRWLRREEERQKKLM